MTKRIPPGDAQGGAERIRKAAITLFRERGYHGTSVRDLARAVDMETASLYYHYPSKHEILIELFHRTMDDMLAGVEQAVAAEVGATARLRAAVRFHVGFHVARQDESFISHSELRAIGEEDLPGIIAKRDRYEKFMRALLSAGVEEGCFEIADVRIAATAILMMCSGVSDWFERRGRLSGASVADHYADMVLRMVVRPEDMAAVAVKSAAHPRKAAGRLRVVGR
jgi:AcrR family transcriptional regulator